MCNNSAFQHCQCSNLTEEQCTVIEWTVGLTDLSVSLLCGIIILLLSLKLKSEVYNSAEKRMSLMLAIIIVLSAWDHCNDFVSMGWCVVALVINSFTPIVLLFYLSIVLAMLLLQIGAPMVPERWKQTPA